MINPLVNVGIMDLVTLIARVGRVLQDSAQVRWSAAELEDYLNDAQLEWVRRVGFPLQREVLPLENLKMNYELPASLLRLERVEYLGKALPIVLKQELDREFQRVTTARNWRDWLGQDWSLLGGNQGSDCESSWKSLKGQPAVVMLENQSSRSFRLVPIPEEQHGLRLANDMNFGFSVAMEFDPFPPHWESIPVFERSADYGVPKKLEFTNNTVIYPNPSEFGMITGIEFQPVVSLFGAIKPDLLSADADEPVIAEEYHKALIDYATYMALSRESEASDVQNALRYLQLFERQVEMAREKEGISQLTYEHTEASHLVVR